MTSKSMPHRLFLALIASLCLAFTARADEPDATKLPAVRKALDKAEADVRRNRKAYDDANAKAVAEAEKALKDEVDRLSKAGKPEEAVAVKKLQGSLRDRVVVRAERKMGPPNPAQAGAVEWNGHKYKVFNERLSWHDAKKRCEEMGGHLVIIENEKEQLAIVDLLVKIGIAVDNTNQNWDGVWIGATDEVKDGQWLWVDGSPVLYHNWLPGEPSNNVGPVNFPAILIHRRGGWDDRPDSNPDTPAFICEWEE